jgi:NDP-sugar pyrophosphorylase family protein
MRVAEQSKLKDIDVVVLCGGLGTRLGNLLGDIPKPMAPVGDRPFLFCLLEHMASFGFGRFVLCAGHMADVIERFFMSIQTSYEIELVQEGEPRGTGGALRQARNRLQSNPVLVINGDSFCSLDYAKMTEAHLSKSADVTIAVISVNRTTGYGSLMVDEDDRIRSFDEKARHEGPGTVNAGVYVFRPGVIDWIEDRIPLSLEYDVFPSLITARLFAYFAHGPLLDIGTPERYQRAKQELLTLMARSTKKNEKA